jgi:prepilin-type N-terminal cleavage/methylation domain-containing protein
MTPSRSRRGFSIVELLVVIAIIGILCSLLMSGVQKARDAANRTACLNNQRQIAIALHVYHDATQAFPPNGTKSFFTAIAPLIDQNNNTGATPVKSFVCPARRSPSANFCDYAGFMPTYSYIMNNKVTQNNPPNYVFTFNAADYYYKSVLGDDDPVRLEDITRGTSNTAMLSEKAVPITAYQGFQFPGDLAWNDPGPPTVQIAYHFTSANNSFSWSDSNGVNYTEQYTYVQSSPIPGAPLASCNTKRQSYFYQDRWWDLSYPWGEGYMGSSHAGGSQPVAFADGSVLIKRWIIPDSTMIQPRQ